MIYTAEELKIKVSKARLMSRSELMENEDKLPAVSNCCWWLSDLDENDEDYVAYAEGSYTEENMYCDKTNGNTYIRVALEITANNVNSGTEFVYCGYMFTVLSDTLAISNNFLGKAKYYDEDLLNYIYTDDEIVCTLEYTIADMIQISGNKDDSEEDDEGSISYSITTYYDDCESVSVCRSFDEAKTKFRETISQELNTQITYYTEMIRDYGDKYYPKGMPDELKKVIKLLKRIVKEPDYFAENAEELDFRIFTDERITVYTKTLEGKELYINSETDECPIMEIRCLNMNEEDEDYYFFISDLNQENKCDIQLEKN